MSNDEESPLIATRYSKDAARVISSIYKNLSIIIYLTIALAAFSILDVLGVLHIIGLSSDYIHDIIVTIVLLILLGILSIVLLYIIRAKRLLNSWHDMFENSSLKTSISILMKDKSKEEALYAIAESIDEINPYIQRYIDSKEISRFIDVEIDNMKFDILIDRNRVDNTLKNVLDEYGSIIVKIVDGKADKSIVKQFYEQLLKYNRITNNKIGLGLLIADEVEPIKVKDKAIDRLLFIEKSKVQ
jgi:hypothetical protein